VIYEYDDDCSTLLLQTMSILLRTNHEHQLADSELAKMSPSVCSGWSETVFRNSVPSAASYESQNGSVEDTGTLTSRDGDQSVSEMPKIEVTPDIGHFVESSSIKNSTTIEDWQFKKSKR
jgi:hypothetical protein